MFFIVLNCAILKEEDGGGFFCLFVLILTSFKLNLYQSIHLVLIIPKSEAGDDIEDIILTIW